MKRIQHLTGEADLDDIMRKVNELVDNNNEKIWKQPDCTPICIEPLHSYPCPHWASPKPINTAKLREIKESFNATQSEQDDVEAYLRDLFPPTYSSEIGKPYEGSEMLYAPYQEVVYHVKRLLEENKN